MKVDHEAQIAIGLDERAREEVSESLGKVLADTYMVYLKTHNFHWNVRGPMFWTYHKMFEEQYQELWEAVDTIAEQIRALGIFAPGTLGEFSRLSFVQEEKGADLDAEAMVHSLVQAHEGILKTLNSAFQVAEKISDQVTQELLTGRMKVHQKTSWMLRSLLE